MGISVAAAILLAPAMPVSAEEEVLAPIHRFFDAFADNSRDKCG